MHMNTRRHTREVHARTHTHTHTRALQEVGTECYQTHTQLTLLVLFLCISFFPLPPSLAVLDVMGVAHELEHPVLEGAYFIDIVISKPPSSRALQTAAAQSTSTAAASSAQSQLIALEVDGPTHFVDPSMMPVDSRAHKQTHRQATVDGAGVCDRRVNSDMNPGNGLPLLNSATLLKRRLLEKEGYCVVSVPFYEWNREQSKTQYLRAKLRDECGLHV